MIRLVQRRLIIPRGDTGEFSIQLLPHFASENIAVFTIIDQRTKKFIFTKQVQPSGDTLTVSFDHNETVNLPEGKYVWDIKLYQNPVFADDELVNGDEIDSYYAAYSLPDCEIRLTGDKLLAADDSPSHTLDVESLNTINAAINETQHAAIEAQGAAENALESANSAADDAAAAADAAATAQDIADHMNNITKVSQLENDVGYINQETDPTVPAWAKAQNKPSYTAQEVGALPSDTFIPANTSDLVNDSNFAVDANYVHTDNNYTTEEKNKLNDIAAGAEVNVNADWNAVSGDAQILNKPTNVSAFFNDAGYLTQHQDISGKADKVTNAVNGNFATLDSNGNLTDSGHKHSDYLVSSLKGANNGIAELGADGKVPSAQLPSYVDDVLEYDTRNSFPATGEAGKIYVAKDTNLTYRWSGSAYVEISQSLALGETSSTAYRGDYGAAAYAHAVTNKGSAFTNGLYKITTNSEGHVTNANGVEKSDITALGIPGELSVTDVQVNGTSILNSTVANIPLAASNVLGVVKTNAVYGVKTNSQGLISTSAATENEIQTGTDDYKPIVPSTVDAATFYGLAKAAGDITQVSTSTFVGDYTDSAKAAILHMLGIDTFVAPRETALNAQRDYAIGDLFMLQGKLYHAITAITIGDIFTEGTNCAQVKISEAFAHDVQVNGSSIVSNGVANVPQANANTLGVIMVGSGLSIGTTGVLRPLTASAAQIQEGTNLYTPITPSNHDASTFYGLSKVAGADLANATVTVGTYPDASKAAIQTMLGIDSLLAPKESDLIADQAYAVGDTFMMDGKLYKVTTAIAEGGAITTDGANANCEITNVSGHFVHDVQANGTSVLSNGVANIPNTSLTNYGVIKIGSGLYVGSNGITSINVASPSQIKGGTRTQYPIDPASQHMSTFYGLAKAAGDTSQSSSSNAVGTYTDNAIDKILTMLGVDALIGKHEGVAASENQEVGDVFIYAGKLYKVTAAIASGATIVPGTNCTQTTLIDIIKEV